jgi:hypothetical protein
LTLEVRTPAVPVTSQAHPAAVILAAADLPELEPATHRSRHHALRGSAGAQLPILVEAPAVGELLGCDGAGVVAPGIDGTERQCAGSGSASASATRRC